ncbi:MAG: hypothetical protein WAV18_14555, partial [Roseiarcus sp.]
ANDPFGDIGIVRTPSTFVSVLQRFSDENVLCDKATKKPPSWQRTTKTHNPSFIQAAQSLYIGFPLIRIPYQAYANIVTGIENANLDPRPNIREACMEMASLENLQYRRRNENRSESPEWRSRRFQT